jgi:CheY-like chemotaxis protein
VYRILIVEDDKLFREQLAQLMAAKLPGSEIVAAADVQEALEFVREARKSGRPFLAAVVDLMLPQIHGSNPELDYAVESEIFRMHGTLIFRITAFDSDAEVREYFDKARMRTSPRVLPVSKTEIGFSKRLIAEIKRDRVARQMAELFAVPTGRVERRGSATLALAALMSDISLFWSDFDEKDREPIREYFDVQEEPDGGVMVRMGGREGSHSIAET